MEESRTKKLGHNQYRYLYKQAITHRAMPNKQWHRDCIAELEIDRKKWYDLRNEITYAMLGSSAFVVGLMAILSASGNDNYMILVGLLLILWIVVLRIKDQSASIKEKEVLKKIKNNYDVLLDHKTN